MEIVEATNLFAYHRGMLADVDRVDRYREAIHAVVKPGDVVLDVGTGTGVLSMFACQAGAQHVYALEAGKIAALARELVRANGFEDRITIINKMSFEATLPEPADVLITETLWSFGVGEGMIGFMADARERLLKPGAPTVPVSVDLFLAPVDTPRLHHVLTQMPSDLHGLDFAVMRSYAANQVQVPKIDPSALLAEEAHLVRVDLDESASANVSATVTFEASRAGNLNGVAGWFEAELTPGIRLGNRPPAEESSWGHVLFPLERPVAVEEGERIVARIDTVANGTVWRWSVEAGGERFNQSTLFGFPHDPTSQGRRAASAQPHRTPSGDALLFVLSKFDGGATVDEIAAELESSNGLFTRPGSAAQFVREAAVRYGA